MTDCMIKIDIYDVNETGSVPAAIEKICRDHSAYASGQNGPYRNYGIATARDWAEQALTDGALAYIDSHDGRVVEALPAERGDADAMMDIGGCYFISSEWSDESRVKIVVPTNDEIMEYPAAAALMARAVIDYHSACSDLETWMEVSRRIDALADAFSNIHHREFAKVIADAQNK